MNSMRMKTNSQSHDEIIYWLILHLSSGFGAKNWRQLFKLNLSPQDICQNPTRLELNAETINSIQYPNWKLIDAIRTWAAKPKRYLVTVQSTHYPPLLKEIHTPPPLLYIDGDLDALRKPQLAIVGARKPTHNAYELAYRFSQQLSEAGLIITSGLAYGIDTASHLGALVNGQTIAVLGHGIDQIYPRQNRNLADKVRENGAIVSEFPLSIPPLAAHFPQRNRIISGLSLGTWVVEAALKSGSLITAKFALNQGREVFAMPSSILNPMASGCHHLIQQGAKLVTSIQDILEELPNYHLLNLQSTRPNLSLSLEGLDINHQKLVQCIGFERASFEQLVCRSGFPVQNVLAMLCNLKLNGYIKEELGGFIRVTK